MPYAHRLVRVTCFGTAFGGQEIWSTGFFLGAEGADAVAPTGEAAAAIGEIWRTFFTNASTNVSREYKCDGVKLALINTDKKTSLDDVETFYYPTAIVGGVTTTLPPQLSLVATLQSNEQRGLAAKGRMYLPGVGAPITPATGKLDVGYTNAMTLQLQTMFNAINSRFDVPGKVVNASYGRKMTIQPGNTVVYGDGRNRLVTSVRVGDVYDTQRRRRNAMQETYSSKSITT